jgi:tetratricopeptide (TPR) repeat protein
VIPTRARAVGSASDEDISDGATSAGSRLPSAAVPTAVLGRREASGGFAEPRSSDGSGRWGPAPGAGAAGRLPDPWPSPWSWDPWFCTWAPHSFAFFYGFPFYGPFSYASCPVSYAPTYASEPYYYDDWYYVDHGGYPASASLEPAESEVDVWLRLGDLFFSQGEFEKAADAYRNAVEAEPEAAAPRIALGETLFVLGQIEEAAVHLRKALEIDSTWLESSANRREAHADPSLFDRRFASLIAHLQDHPFDAAGRFVAGYFLWFAGDLEASRAHLSLLREILVEDPVADLVLSRIEDRVRSAR